MPPPPPPGVASAPWPGCRHLLLFAALLLASPSPGAAIDCFKCVSVNGNYRPCDDPFHNNYSDSILEAPCMGGRKGRNGVFPATACIKLVGVFDNGTRITVRTCALDSGTLTTDTEIIRMSHCGGFYFNGGYVRGCLQSCDDADACNVAPGAVDSLPTLLMVSSILTFIITTFR
uniref:Ly6/neurotoxin 7 n=1 Tax=Locusta migratoria manilensis TaxID=229990 RepID=A0A1Y0F4B5_LOCMI|nr:ly6/neurotoxin 7 [Locusta migratoria manilensis]